MCWDDQNKGVYEHNELPVPQNANVAKVTVLQTNVLNIAKFLRFFLLDF